MTLVLRGIVGPVVTTFDEQGEVDHGAFADNIRAHVAAGLEGIVVTGSTGEAALLDENERMALLTTARKVVPQDRLLFAGTGTESTRTTLRYTRLAADRGVNAVLVVAPHYYANVMSFEALDRHYRTVADESPVPVVLYNIPKYMHFSLAPALVQELAHHENVAGIKDSSGNLELLSSYINAASEHFAVLTGHASTLKEALSMGAKGGILAASLFAPEITIDLYRSMGRGDAASAQALQERLAPLNAKIVGELGIAGVKAALDLVGLRGGPLRSPLLPLAPAVRAQVAELLRNAEVSKAA